MNQVISIGSDGRISGLQRKRGQGLDLRQFGPCDIKRASEIVPSEDGQLWAIEGREYGGVNVPLGLLDGAKFTTTMYVRATGKNPHDLPCAVDPETDVMWFDDYDEAVRVEIEMLDGYRVRGLF